MFIRSDVWDGVCKDCKVLATDVVTGIMHSENIWQIYQAGHNTVHYFKNHLDGTVAGLHRSSELGCQICGLIYDQVWALDTSPMASSYQIFVSSGLSDRGHFHVTLGDIKMFAEHISLWEPWKTLVFFGQVAPSYVNQPPLSSLSNQHPGSPTAFQQAREWLADCQNKHPQCQRLPSRLPKRVLDLGKPDKELRVSLYITQGEIEEYAALSYSWGETRRLVTGRKPSGQSPTGSHVESLSDLIIMRREPDPKPNQTKLDFTLEPFCNPDDIPVDAFPRTLRDALRIAKGLRFRYLWIDALCILQGDELDWDNEIAAMTQIYGGSTLTISASCNKTSAEGILDELKDGRLLVGTWKNPKELTPPGEIHLHAPLTTLDLEEKFISTRGWVFQERLVSTATLHYTDEGMLWECASETRMDHAQSVSNHPWKAKWRDMMNRANSKTSDRRTDPQPGRSPYEAWHEWICAYSERNLYNSEDKFPAIAGVAKTFAHQFDLGVGAYVAGLWRGNFEADLLWRCYSWTQTLIQLNSDKEKIAPSWSWGSVKGRLEYRNMTLIEAGSKGPNLKILSIDVFEKRPGSFGHVIQGSFRAEGLLQPVIVDRQKKPGVRKRNYQECGVSRGFRNNDNILCMLDEWDDAALPEYPCWCLRIGSYERYGMEGDFFLLLDHLPGTKGEFYRVGFAETDPFFSGQSPTPLSGLFESPTLTPLTVW